MLFRFKARCISVSGITSFPAAVKCPYCGRKALLFPTAETSFPWLFCYRCKNCCRFVSTENIIKPRENVIDSIKLKDLPRLNLFIKKLCGVSCNNITQLQRVADLFSVASIRGSFKKRKIVCPVYDAPGKICGAINVKKSRNGSYFLVFTPIASTDGKDRRFSLKFDRKHLHFGGLLFANKILQSESKHRGEKTLFIFPFDDALRLHVEHAKTCDCLLPVVSLTTCGHDSGRINLLSLAGTLQFASRRIICCKWPIATRAPEYIDNWALLSRSKMLVYDKLPEIVDVHKFLDSVSSMKLREPGGCGTEFVDVEPLYPLRDSSIIVLDSHMFIRDGIIYDEYGNLISNCIVRIREIILSREKSYNLMITYKDYSMTTVVEDRRRFKQVAIEAVRNVCGEEPIINLPNQKFTKLVLSISTPHVVWRR